jgi:hypothetical protein
VADSKRLVILKALTAHLQGITPANGYQHDLSASVYRGRAVFSAETPLPCINIVEALNPDREPSRTSGRLCQKDDWVLLVQGWTDAEDDGEAPTDPAHLLMADVKKRLGVLLKPDGPYNANADHLLGGLVEDILVEPGTVRAPDETSSRAYFYLRVVVGVTEYLDDPYRLD